LSGSDKRYILFVSTEQLIVSFLIAQRFLNAKEVFIPINRVIENEASIVNALALALAYFIVIS
jgi:hypothetical protein